MLAIVQNIVISGVLVGIFQWLVLQGRLIRPWRWIFAYLLMQTGHIPTVRLGRSIRVRPHDLVEYIEENIHRQKDQP
jgi:hypothetical protein